MAGHEIRSQSANVESRIVKASSWVGFTVLRLLAFFVPLAVLLIAGVNPWLSALLSAIIGLCVSYIFLRRPREKVSTAIYDARHPDKPVVHVDDESEDAAIDRAQADARQRATASERERGAQTDADDQTHEARELQRKDELG